jgi:SAM-dependent methyltransferase
MKICSACGNRFDSQGWECPSCSHKPPTLDGHLAFAPKLAEESEGFEAGYFTHLAQLEERSFWFRSRNKLVTWTLQTYFPQGRSFLEIGCGTGFVLSGIRDAFPAMELYGSEVFSAGLSFAADRVPGATLFQMDARKIPFDGEVDVIGAFDVLEHIKDDEGVLAQMRQAVRQGIILTVPQHPFLWSEADEYARHVRRYKASELRNRVERAGFRILRMTSFVSLLLPLMVLSRLKQKISKEEFDPTAEISLGRFVDNALEKTLGVERSMIRAGVSFPAGGSLLLVARKR